MRRTLVLLIKRGKATFPSTTAPTATNIAVNGGHAAGHIWLQCMRAVAISGPGVRARLIHLSAN
jgi:hypothetical protein